MLKPWPNIRCWPLRVCGSISLAYITACFSSGVRIIITSAHLAASVGVTTLRPSCSALGLRGGVRLEADDEVLHAALAQVERVGMALAAIANDGDLLRLDDREIGVGFVIDFHRRSPWQFGRPIRERPVIGN